jgi:hypothetical protein
MKKEKMTEIIKKQPFGWRETNGYTILDLGTMPNAIVIKKEEQGNRFLISLRSYFSFPDNFYKLRFEMKQEAIKKACDYLSEWLEDLNAQLPNRVVMNDADYVYDEIKKIN